jgi:3-methylcrotonyl-CoA carboxylase alpha subunit
MLRSVLIANRGEIACRVIRTVQRLGMRAVAVYSDADAGARHVRLADAAVHIGPAPARDSYLDIAVLIAAARAAGADGIHPGYGFLAENADFAQACADAGVTFIGPPASAIAAMGSKSAAKALMEPAGVPLVPGYHGADQADAVLREHATRIGYPLLVKAAAGGGGRGMRRVNGADELDESLAAARREALAAFGDATLLLERYLTGARHVEVQVFADGHGNAVYVGERDCSLQRRHQKVIEEAPAPGVDEHLRRAMGEAAVRAARAVDYRGAGTVEFMLTPQGEFYFLEMNTRLQVEHPVTEMVTGFDLVEWQLRVAAGEPLPMTQDAIRLTGHAIEARLYAEDPAQGFLPVPGRLAVLDLPAGEGLRVDAGYDAGDTVPPHYDALIAKLIAWGETREQARERLAAMLAASCVIGAGSNLAFLSRLIELSAFVSGEPDTGLIEREIDGLITPAPVDDTTLRAAAVRVLADEAAAAPQALARGNDVASPWVRLGPFRTGVPARRTVTFVDASGEAQDVKLLGGPHGYTLADAPDLAPGAALPDGRVRVNAGGAARGVQVWRAGAAIEVSTPAGRWRLTHREAVSLEGAGDDHEARLVAPMPGKLVQVAVQPGQRVAKGELLVVLEAMKMEHRIVAPHDGVVGALGGALGDFVAADTVLVEFAAEEAA